MQRGVDQRLNHELTEDTSRGIWIYSPLRRDIEPFVSGPSIQPVKFTKASPKAKDGDATLFVLEIDYVGIFHVENVPEDQMHPFLLIECPRMIFPFLRRVVSDVTRDGGFPPLNLENIDFVALYRNEIARRQAENTQKADA